MIAVGWMETPGSCCVMTACLNVRGFKLSRSLTLPVLSLSPFPYLYLVLLLALSLSWYYSIFFFSLSFFVFRGGHCSVLCAEWYFFFFVHHCILPYPWANNSALIPYHCHPLNFENCHLKTWYNGWGFLSPINLLLQGILLGFFPGILCMNFVLCIARVLFIF